MPFRPLIILAGALLLPSLGLSQKVRFDYDHGADFSKFHTYRMVKIAENPDVSQLADQRITSALEEELAKKGLMKVDTGGDLLVGYQAAVTHETQYTTFNDGNGYYGYGWGGGGFGGTSTTTATTIPTGSLTVDMMDPVRKQLVFRVTGSDTLSDKPDKNTKKLKKAMDKMFDKYPPKKG